MKIVERDGLWSLRDEVGFDLATGDSTEYAVLVAIACRCHLRSPVSSVLLSFNRPSSPIMNGRDVN